jgi:small-conductance mechanosensitive channel
MALQNVTHERGKIMRNFTGQVLSALAAGTTTAYAAAGTESSSPGFFTIAFLAFLAAIIAIQFIPGLILFFGLLRGIFSASTKKKVSAVSDGNQDHID